MPKVPVTLVTDIDEETIECPGESATIIYSNKFYIADADIYGLYLKGENSPKLKISYEVTSFAIPDSSDWADGAVVHVSFTETDWKADSISPVIGFYIRIKIERLVGNGASAKLNIRLVRQKRSIIY